MTSPLNRRAPRRRSISLSLFWLACLSLLVAGAMPGCGGCTSDDAQQAKSAKKKEEEQKKKKQEKPKEDFEATSLRVQPYDSTGGLNRVKPGHWTAAHVAMKANNFHFNAELETATVDSRSQPLAIEHTPYRMVVTRPAALPKGQVKDFEATYYVPRRVEGDNRGVWLQCRLRAAGSGREVAQAMRMQGTVRMPDYQYYFVVLADEPDSYRYLSNLDSVQPPNDEFNPETPIKYFEVVRPRTDGRSRIPLPSHPLAWSSIGYLLWDDLDPGRLGPDQQRSLLDWLHWGGQVIVSGPGSLEKLRGSFLDPYLPAEYVKSRELDATAFADINSYWSRPNPEELEEYLDMLALHVQEKKPLLGVEWKPRPASAELPHTGGLVIERRAGRGRVVATAFPLNVRDVINWRNLDTFFNSCLLRRPPREFLRPNDFLSEPRGYFRVGQYKDEVDARLSTMLRYFSRDIGHLDSGPRGDEAYLENAPPLSAQEQAMLQFQGMYDTEPRDEQREEIPREADVDDPHFGGFVPVGQSGMAGWNDYNGCAAAARTSLREAAGITIPKSDFVFRVLGVYLLVLVPLNWFLFRLIGRVELAWVAAPIIAIAGAVAVVRFAQLDIGFARARTEVAVLEAQGDYARAHVTRYTALYTSLSTSYDMSMNDESSLAQPFALNPTGDPLANRATSTVSFRHDAENVLSGFQVASNSTGMLHEEQMFNMGGAIRLAGDEQNGWRVENDSDMALRDVAVLRKTNGGAQVAWIGALEKKGSAELAFQGVDAGLRAPQWSQSPVTSPPDDPDSGEVSLWQLFDLATKQLRLNEGEVRLLGWTDTSLRGVQFYPSASQLTARTMVLVHLRHADLPRARIDVRSRWVDRKKLMDDRRRFDREEEEKEKAAGSDNVDADAADADADAAGAADQPEQPESP